MTASAPETLPRSCPAATGQDSDRRSRTQVGRARWQCRRLKGWRPRLPSEATETSQKPSGRSRGRISHVSRGLRGIVLAPGTLRVNTRTCGTMTTPMAAQADHF